MRRTLSLALLCLLSGLGQADTLLLEDGRVFDGLEIERRVDSVRVHFENGVVTIPNSRVRECIIPGEPEPRAESDEDIEKQADGYVYFDGSWVKPRVRDRAVAKLIEEQAARVVEMKEGRLWRNRHIEETKHFRFESTVPPHIFERYRDLIEAYYTEFTKVFRVRAPRGMGPLKVSFYVDKDAFHRVTGTSRGVGGYFVLIPPYEVAIYYDRSDPMGTEQVIYHEVGHYLQKLLDLKFRMPHFPGEAVSEYYGASHWNAEEGELEVGLILESRLSQIQLDIKDGFYQSLRGMLLGARDGNGRDYSWGWSLVHFLMNHDRYKSKFPKFLTALAHDGSIDREPTMVGSERLKTVSGQEVHRVFMKILRIKDDEKLQELEREWHDYINEELKISSSRGLEVAAWGAYWNDRIFRAKRLFEEAEHVGNMSALGYHRFAQVLVETGDSDLAEVKWQASIEVDPLEAEYYIEYGKFLLQQSKEEKKAEGKRLLKLAYEVDPDNFYLERNLESLLKD